MKIILIILRNFILKGQMETQYGKQMCPLGPLTFCPYRDRPSVNSIFFKYFARQYYSRFYISEPTESLTVGKSSIIFCLLVRMFIGNNMPETAKNWNESKTSIWCPLNNIENSIYIKRFWWDPVAFGNANIHFRLQL